jgi:hypothetical protein
MNTGGSGDGFPEAAGGSDGMSCYTLPISLIAHACLHADYGPFVDVRPRERDQGPEVSEPHTAYEVEVSPRSERWLKYRSMTEGAYVFFTDAGFIEHVEDSTGLVHASHRSSVDGCSKLGSATVLELSAASVNEFEMPIDSRLLVVESLDAFGGFDGTCSCEEVGSACESSGDCCSAICRLGVCSTTSTGGACGGASSSTSNCAGGSGGCDETGCDSPAECRSSGPCVEDSECCLFCHDQDHCH